MPDISMCMNRACPSRHKCYRYTATPSPMMQSWARFDVPPRRRKCDSFMKIERSRNANRRER